MIRVHRAAERFRSDHEGITTWHAFSAGAHYDAANVSFGPLVACDEHQLAPGAGFARHRHARVELLTWVLDGAVRHQDDLGRSHVVQPGQVQYQRAGRGIAHVERNDSARAPLRFVQFWLISDAAEPAYAITTPPAHLTSGTLTVHRDGPLTAAPQTYLFVCSGTYRLAGSALSAGDSVRATEPVDLTGTGELLVLTLSAS